MSIFIILHQALVCMFDLRIVFILRWREYKLGVDFQMKHQWAEIPWWKMIEQCQASLLRRCSVKKARRKEDPIAQRSAGRPWLGASWRANPRIFQDHGPSCASVENWLRTCALLTNFHTDICSCPAGDGNANAVQTHTYTPAHCISKVKWKPFF